MKYLNNFEKHNEGIGSHIRKLGSGDRENTKGLFLGRATDDIEAKKIFKEMKDDFEKYDKDVRKSKIFGDSMVYYMGKFDSKNNSPGVGNVPEDGYQKKIKVSAWKGKGLEISWGRIEVETITPNNEDGGARINRNEESFKISYDIAKKIHDYFNDEYVKQYPELKDAEYKNLDQIRNIKTGKKATLGYLYATDPKGENITYSYKDIKDKKKIEKYINNNPVFVGRNYKRNHITYFTIPGESEDLVRDNIMNMEHDDVEKQNLERVYK